LLPIAMCPSLLQVSLIFVQDCMIMCCLLSFISLRYFSSKSEDLLYRDNIESWSFNVVSKENMVVCILEILYLRLPISVANCWHEHEWTGLVFVTWTPFTSSPFISG
jgi:hypothetical protein